MILWELLWLFYFSVILLLPWILSLFISENARASEAATYDSFTCYMLWLLCNLFVLFQYYPHHVKNKIKINAFRNLTWLILEKWIIFIDFCLIVLHLGCMMIVRWLVHVWIFYVQYAVIALYLVFFVPIFSSSCKIKINASVIWTSSYGTNELYWSIFVW